MFKKIFIILLGIVLLGSHILQARETNTVVEKLQTDKAQAIKLYKAKKYEQAYQLFSSLYLSVLSDVKVNFLLGRCAFETGRYEMALASYERVSILDEKNVRNQLEIARTQFELQMYEESRIGFNAILANPTIPKTVRTNVELFLSRIDNQLERSFFFARAKFGLTHDDNVNFGSLDSTYVLPDYGTFASASEQSDISYDTELSATHIYDIGEKNGYSIRNTLNIFHKMYDTMQAFDITFFSYNPAISFQTPKTTYEFNIMIDKMLLSDTEFLNIYSVMPTFLHKLDAETIINGNFKIAKKEFMHKGPANDYRDAINYAASLSYQKLWTSSFMTFKLSADMDRKVRGNRIDVDYKNYIFNYDYTQQVLPGFTLRGDLEYRLRKFSDYSNLFKNTRKDSGYRAGVTATKKLTPTVFLEARAFYEKTNSNQAVFAFDKRTLNIAISKSF